MTSFILLVIAWFFYICGFFITISCFVGIIRTEDYLIKLHAIKVSNIYGISFVLIGILILNFNIINLLYFILIIILNIITTLIVIHSVGRTGYRTNVGSNSMSRKEYDNYLTKQKTDAE